MKQLVCLGLFLFVLMSKTFAVNMSSLYQAEVPIASQTDDLKEQAIRDGFLQVLIKVSGNEQIGQNPVIKSSLQKASYYVQEYTYSQPTTSSSEYILQIRYEPSDVLRLLKKAGVAYWRETRPLILVWLASQNKQDSEIVGGDTQENFLTSMKAEGKKYGLPLIFPMMDMTDVSQVSVTNITEMDLPTLRAASQRYSPDGLLIGKLVQTQEGVDSQWTLLLNGQTWHFTLTQKTREALIPDVINDIMQVLTKQYAVKTTTASSSWLKLVVSNVTQGDDLKRLMQHLEQLTPVQQVRLDGIQGDTVELDILINGPREGFEQSVVIGQHLILKSPPDSTEGSLTYAWVH